MSTKLVLVTGLSLTVGLALPAAADSAGVTISAGGCITISGVTCTGASSVAPPIVTGSGSSVASSDPFAGVVDYAAYDSLMSVSVDSTLTYDHVTGIAFAQTGGKTFTVLSDTQGIVLIPEQFSGGSSMSVSGSTSGSGAVIDPSAVTTLATGAASAPTGVVVDDLDGDGNDDIIAVDSTDGTLSIMFGQSDGTFAPPVVVSLASKPTQFVFADADGDGHPDLLVPDAAGTLDVYINDGHGGFAAHTAIPVGTRPFSIAGADLDGDGKADLVVGSDDDSVSVLLNDGHGGFTLKNTYSTGGVRPDHVYLGRMIDGPVFISVTDAADDAGAYFQGKGDGSFEPAVLNDGGNCATTICATAIPTTSGSGSTTTPKPKPKPVVAMPASGGGGDLGLPSLVLLGIAALRRRFAR